MYELGEQFKLNYKKALPNNECVLKGQKYRITVLTERLVRLEYNENGVFIDAPTELVWYRNFKKPIFRVNETNSELNIITKYFSLTYSKEKNFKGTKLSPTQNLKIALNHTDKVWYYNHPEIRNFDASVFGLDDTKDRTLKKSLYSLDGFASIDDSNSNIILENGTFKKRDTKGIDIYVFLYNTDFYYCLNDYFMITGYPPLIPRYTLGNWWDKKDAYNDFEVAHLIKKFEDNNIPISVFILNNWEKESSFAFNDYFKNPIPIIEYVKSKNIKLGLAIENYKMFKSGSDIFNKLKNYLYTDKDGNIPFNLFDAKTVDAFLKLLIEPLNQMGVSLYSINTFDQKDLDRLTILKHFLYYNSFKNNIRPIITARNSHMASHRYPILYAGKSDVSWDTLKKIPSFNASASNMGISFFSHDVGGSSGGIEDGELFTRFVQLSVFSPILRLGSDSGKFYKREPWKWGLKVKEITTKFLNLRHQLIPYTYTESYKYHKYGKPIIEPIYYRYPVLYDSIYKDEYFFGSTFLVSPITTKKEYLMNRVIQKIYIPDGTWYGYFTGKQYKGNRKYTSFYRDQEYPVFVKAGAIIPLAITNNNDTSSPTNLEIQVFPGDSNTYSIYEDDGITNNYLRTEFLITNVEFVYQKNNYKLTILPVAGKSGVIPEKRNYKIRFKNTKPTSIISTYLSSKQISNNHYKDDTDLIIEVNDIPTNAQLTVICKGNDIEIEALRIIRDDITEIISDLPIKTVVKQRIDDIMFSNSLDLKKKRIEIRKLGAGKDYLEKKYIELLLKLLEYIGEV